LYNEGMVKDKGIYAPGELAEVKKRLGPIDDREARRMQKILGGEIGTERREAPAARAALQKRRRRSPAAGGGPAGAFTAQPAGKRPAVIQRGAGESGRQKSGKPYFVFTPPDYFERVKIDKRCGEEEYGIKTAFQVFVSRMSLLAPPVKDKVSPHFVMNTFNEYYRHLEVLVSSARYIFPRNGGDRNFRLKKISGFAFRTLDVLRRWNVSVIIEHTARLQKRPRSVTVEEFSPIVREFYRPLFILEALSAADIENAFEILYRMIFLDKPDKETEKLRNKITDALAAYQYIKSNIRRLLYPLLMKLCGSKYYTYEEFFEKNRENILLFLGLTEEEKLKPPALNEDGGTGEGSDAGARDEPAPAGGQEKSGKQEGESPEEKAEAEKKVTGKGINLLMRLFPASGLDALETGCDLYPYFAGTLDLKKGSEIISPLDPAQFALVLTHIIKELSYGFRTMKFSFLYEDDIITPVLEGWSNMLEENFYNNYIPRIDEYARLIFHQEAAATNYSMSLLNDIHRLRRCCLFPHYNYSAGIPAGVSRKEKNTLFASARKLRSALTEIAEDIGSADREEGAGTGAECKYIKNPRDNYCFEIANPLSERLNYLFPKNKRTNISLIYVTLSVCTVLDNYLNNPDSIAYKSNRSVIFRSVDNLGREPVLWVDRRSDTFEIFKHSLVSRRKSI